MRIRLTALLLAALCFPAGALAASPPGHAGRWITDAQGRVLIPHGLNVVYKVGSYAPSSVGFGQDDARFLANNGFTVVRLGVIYTAVEPAPGSYDDAYLANIARTVATLGKYGIYSLLDFHQDMYNERFAGEGFPDWSVQDDGLPNQPNAGFPGNYVSMPALQHAFDHLWANSPGPGGVGLADRFAAAWQHVAERFKGNANVIGYDLLNEPWPGTDWAPCASPAGCPAFDATLAAFQKRTITAIRKADTKHIAWYEPNVLFDFGAPTHMPDLGDSRAGLSFHDYCQTEGAPNCPTFEKQGLTNAVDRSKQTGDALLLTEWGSTDNATTLTRMADEADAQLMPWTEWAYCGCQEPTGSVPPSTEGLIFDMNHTPAGSNVKLDKLDILARPHPDAVAGTPLSLSDSGLRFSWSTTRAAGHGRFPAGSCTSYFVPRLKHGYSVSVKGGRVVSAPSAKLLQVVSRRGAKSISLRLRPKAHGHPSGSISAAGRCP